MSDSDLLTLDQAAAEVGWEGKYRRDRMLRRIEAREKQIGRPILSRVMGPKQERRTISRGALHKHFPELFDQSLDEMGRSFRRILTGIDAKLDERIENHPKIRELQARDETIMRDLNALAKRVARVL